MRIKKSIFTFLLCTFTVFSSAGYASDVIVFNSLSQESASESLLSKACRFYGLKCNFVSFSDVNSDMQPSNTPDLTNVKATAISAQVLHHSYIKKYLNQLHLLYKNPPTILIYDINPSMESRILQNISDSSLTACRQLSNTLTNVSLNVVGDRSITHQLADQSIPYSGKTIFYLDLKSRIYPTPIMEISSGSNSHLPIFVKATNGMQKTFFLTEMGLPNSDIGSKKKFWIKKFFHLAPFLMFLRYSFAERCWHAPNHYANLTIDDPYLKEPYGSLSYKNILEEMKKTNFHLTIAFIPWNFDKNEPDVITLFKNNPDRFSISIHGNNHDQKEFYKYNTDLEDPYPARTLADQETDIKQAVARMEILKTSTGLSYDRVMIFPHRIAPSKTLGLLKKYNFLAVCNRSNIPLGSMIPTDPLFELRRFTMIFENFTCIKRNLTNLREILIAIYLFLDNPVVLCGHVSAYDNLFSNGIDSFNQKAAMINTIQPDIIWQSLGYISKHLYLQRLRDDGNYDIKAFCRSIVIENFTQSELTYFYQKEDPFSPSIKNITVDGNPHPYSKSKNTLFLTLTAPPGESRTISIQYKNDLDIASIDVTKNIFRVNCIRHISDLRDNFLSSNKIGRLLINFYYDSGFSKNFLMLLSVSILLFITLILFSVLLSTIYLLLVKA